MVFVVLRMQSHAMQMIPTTCAEQTLNMVGTHNSWTRLNLPFFCSTLITYIKDKLALCHIQFHVLEVQSAQQSQLPKTEVVVADVTCLILVALMMPLTAMTQNLDIFAWATRNMVYPIWLPFYILRKIILHPITGYLCPTSHPYACAMGSKCSSAVWKPITADIDCDGGRLLDKSSICCPTEGVISCNGDQRYQCWSNPSFQGR